ncbi:MAG TPA: FAD-binding protein [Rubrobacter sp.]|nr:FAD-binding protein [Rubrobacter sp.]
MRFDAMREIQLPESGEDWVEVEPGVTWMVLEERLRERGIGPTVYPRSAPRSTVGGWLADNGLGVGSFEYGWLLATKKISALVEATSVRPVGEERGWIGQVHRRTDVALGYGLRPREAAVVRGMVLAPVGERFSKGRCPQATSE